jgi:hypothetical protein
MRANRLNMTRSGHPVRRNNNTAYNASNDGANAADAASHTTGGFVGGGGVGGVGGVGSGTAVFHSSLAAAARRVATNFVGVKNKHTNTKTKTKTKSNAFNHNHTGNRGGNGGGSGGSVDSGGSGGRVRSLRVRGRPAASDGGWQFDAQTGWFNHARSLLSITLFILSFFFSSFLAF